MDRKTLEMGKGTVDPGLEGMGIPIAQIPQDTFLHVPMTKLSSSKAKQTRELIKALKMPFPNAVFPKEMVKVLFPRPCVWASMEYDVPPDPTPDEAYSIQDLLNMPIEDLRELRHRIFEVSHERRKIMPVALAPLLYNETEGFFANVAGMADPESLLSDFPPVPLFDEHLAEVWRTWDMLLLLVDSLSRPS